MNRQQPQKETVRLNRVISRVDASAEYGLTRTQARERLENGYANIKPDSQAKTVGQIFKTNIFSYFNLIFLVLALCIVAVKSYNDLTFLPIIIANIIIGIVQELRSKFALEKLTFMSEQKASVIRDGKRISVPTEETVLDDIAVFSSGTQIYADAIVKKGQCNVNEALVTGEADEIEKRPGDTLLSGSFIVSGECAARLDKVGRDSFVAGLMLEAKKAGKRKRPGMVPILQRLVQIIGILIIPIGAGLLFQQLRQPEIDFQNAVVSTIAALIGMIPEGLFLLVSVALTVSVLRLAKRRTLVQEMRCVESLARVDVLCVDKTGTITETRMDVKGTVPLCENHFNTDDINEIMTDYAGNSSAENETMNALQAYFPNAPRRRASAVLPFSSATKYSGVSFSKNESYLLGAPERILLSKYSKYQNVIEAESAKGYRVLLLALYEGDIREKLNERLVTPVALVLLSNRVREAAPKTFRFFAKQGVKIIVISGDNPVTVSQIAHEAGIEGAERYIDAAELTTDKRIKRAVGEYVVFGRVTPDQKRRLVRALKGRGHTVAMTGDGVNDVLALKDADCSIAMASGSEVASQVSDIVLLDSDFSAMPAVVLEGRRVINNIERSASLFLVRNIFSFLLALVAIALARQYPFYPSQLALFGGLLIGVPSFVLALEPNKEIVKGKFMINVLKNALPAALTDFAALTALIVLAPIFGIPAEQQSTMANIIIAFVGFLMLYKLCRPLNPMRITLIVTMLVGFILGSTILSDLFSMAPLDGANIWITIVFCLISAPIMLLLSVVFQAKKRD